MAKTRFKGGNRTGRGQFTSYGRDRTRRPTPGWQQSEPFSAQQIKRAERWHKSRPLFKGGIPPRHIAAAMGWHYVRQPNGEILHVPPGVR